MNRFRQFDKKFPDLPIDIKPSAYYIERTLYADPPPPMVSLVNVIIHNRKEFEHGIQTHEVDEA